RHADRRPLRAFRSEPLRAARVPTPRGANRSPLRAVQPNPSAARALSGSHTGLSRRRDGRSRLRRSTRPDRRNRGRPRARPRARTAAVSHATLRRYLDEETSERASEEAGRWIKALRTLEVDGRPMRDRFTYRGDSLWWFAELYLHKQAVIERAWRAVLALDAFCERERSEERRVGKEGRTRGPRDH